MKKAAVAGLLRAVVARPEAVSEADEAEGVEAEKRGAGEVMVSRHFAPHDRKPTPQNATSAEEPDIGRTTAQTEDNIWHRVPIMLYPSIPCTAKSMSCYHDNADQYTQFLLQH